jgi:hypothetical protein
VCGSISSAYSPSGEGVVVRAHGVGHLPRLGEGLDEPERAGDERALRAGEVVVARRVPEEQRVAGVEPPADGGDRAERAR